MDAVIRFSFCNVEPEEIDDMEKYAKIYAQAKWVWDAITVAAAAKALKGIM